MARPTTELRRPLLRYVAGVTTAHLMAVAELSLVVTVLGRQTNGAARTMFEGRSSGIVAAVLILAIAVVVAGSSANLLPSLR